MVAVRLRLPRWSTHPVFGMTILLVLAVSLIVHGEPQPSSRPSGRSVVVTSATPAAAPAAAFVLIAGDVLQRRAGGQVASISLPIGVQPVSVQTSGTMSIVLGIFHGRQHAYRVTSALKVADLGLADGVIPSSYPGAAIAIEAAVTDPGRVLPPGVETSSDTAPSVSSAPRVPTRSAGSTAAGASTPRAVSTDPATTALPAQARDYLVRRYDRAGRRFGPEILLPPADRIAVDTAVGLVVWKPIGPVSDGDVVLESLSAEATLIRPDGSLRVIGAVHPLAATLTQLLVWDVARRQFGIMSLTSVTATSTATATATAFATATATATSTGTVTSSDTATASDTAITSGTAITASVSASPTTVADTHWFSPTRGFDVIGPGSFSLDGSAFAAYAQVGNRRRLVVGQLADIGTDQIEVLALAQPATPSSSPPSSSPTRFSSAGETAPAESDSSAITPRSNTAGATNVTTPQGPAGVASAPLFDPEGFPVPAPVTPVWQHDYVLAVATDGTVIGYQPGSKVATVRNLGITAVHSLAIAP